MTECQHILLLFSTPSATSGSYDRERTAEAKSRATNDLQVLYRSKQLPTGWGLFFGHHGRAELEGKSVIPVSNSGKILRTQTLPPRLWRPSFFYQTQLGMKGTS
jgi:hypothetical protein